MAIWKKGPRQSGRSRVEQLVALLSALETLNPLVVHLLCHLLIPKLLLLGLAAVLDALDMGLGRYSRSVIPFLEGEVGDSAVLWRPPERRQSKRPR